MHTGFWWKNLSEGDHLEDPCVDGTMILKWLLETGDEGSRVDRSGSGWGQVAGCCERGNEPSVSIKYGEFPD